MPYRPTSLLKNSSWHPPVTAAVALTCPRPCPLICSHTDTKRSKAVLVNELNICSFAAQNVHSQQHRCQILNSILKQGTLGVQAHSLTKGFAGSQSASRTCQSVAYERLQNKILCFHAMYWHSKAPTGHPNQEEMLC